MKRGFSSLIKGTKFSSGFLSGMLNQYKHILVVGGSNSLGNSIISTFSETWKVANLDFEENTNAHFNILLKKDYNLTEGVESIEKEIESFSKRFDTIICVNESWRKGSINNKDIFAQYNLVEEEQTLPALLSSYLACKYSAPNGLVLFTGGAVPMQKACPKALNYGVSKDVVHTIALNLADKEDISNDVTIATILPDINLDLEGETSLEVQTENNKLYEKTAEMIKTWADGKNRPMNGSYILLKSAKNMLIPEYL